MKYFFQKIVSELVKIAISKLVSDILNNSKMQYAIVQMNESKKNIWKFVIQALISILTAMLTALSETSCIGIH